MGLVSFLIRLAWSVGEHIPIPPVQPAHATRYVTLFALGTMAKRQGWLANLSPGLVRFWRRATLAASLVMIGAFAIGSGEGLDPYLGGPHWQSFAFSLWEQTYCVGIIVLLLDRFGRSFDRQGPLLRAARSLHRTS